MKKGKKSTFNQGMVKTNRLQNKLTLAAGIVFMSLNTAWAASQCNVFDADAKRVRISNSPYDVQDTVTPSKNTGSGGALSSRTTNVSDGGECDPFVVPWHPISHDEGNGQSIADGDKIKLHIIGRPRTNEVEEGGISPRSSERVNDDALFYIIDSKGVKQPTLAGFTFHRVGSFG